jgi:hypothetical protein
MCQGCSDSGKMGSASSGADQDSEATRFGGPAIVLEPRRGPVGGDDVAFVGDAELGEGGRCFLHRWPVGLASHEDAYLGVIDCFVVGHMCWVFVF